MTSVKRDENWWVTPEIGEVVDSFTGLELHPLSDAVVTMPFPKYGLWWLLVLDGQFDYQGTEGPYVDEITAIEAGMRLVV